MGNVEDKDRGFRKKPETLKGGSVDRVGAARRARVGEIKLGPTRMCGRSPGSLGFSPYSLGHHQGLEKQKLLGNYFLITFVFEEPFSQKIDGDTLNPKP